MMNTQTICPYCYEEVSTREMDRMDSVDYCYVCGRIVEGQTLKVPAELESREEIESYLEACK